MYLFKKLITFRKQLNWMRSGNRKIGFVPTMGALHEGHLSLVRQSVAECHITIVSIFVNPTQFNERTDLDKYPRSPSKDLKLLAEVGCNIVFMPATTEVYPPGWKDLMPDFRFGYLENTMEGKFRPGHFTGVAQVLYRLLDILEPQLMYMGQKDFQQTAIVRKMLQQSKQNVRLVVCPIIREENGLAMSSRNQRLQPEVRDKAAIIYQTLREAKMMTETKSPQEIQQKALTSLSIPGFQPEYFDIVDRHSLKPILHFNNRQEAVACTALWADNVRLIDNIYLF